MIKCILSRDNLLALSWVLAGDGGAAACRLSVKALLADLWEARRRCVHVGHGYEAASERQADALSSWTVAKGRKRLIDQWPITYYNGSGRQPIKQSLLAIDIATWRNRESIRLTRDKHRL
jgi:hypothetical protein